MPLGQRRCTAAQRWYSTQRFTLHAIWRLISAPTQPGTMTAKQYDEAVADLVNYMKWMAEPAQNTRVRVGVWVMLFLLGFMVIAWRLNASYWKDVR